MARDTKRKKSGGMGRRIRRWALTALGILLIVTLIGMNIEARVVHLRYADVQLADLPSAFEGFEILYISDLHIDALNSPPQAYALIQQLNQLEPDVILLGGDYTTYGLDNMLRRLVRISSYEQEKKRETTRRDQFFILMNGIQPKYGKYGVAGNHDNYTDGLEQSMGLGGVTLLRNQAVEIRKDGAKLVLMGIDDWDTGINDVARLAETVRGSDCVILMSHSPDALPIVSNQPAADGRQWADLMLSGHTHGGQIRPFGLDLMSVSEYGVRYRTGWIRESGTELLVSNGVGTTFASLRMNAPAQAHLLTLHSAGALMSEQRN